MLVLFPHEFGEPRRPDEHFAREAAATRALGVEVGLVDHDLLASGNATNAIRQIPESADAVYRGWMLGAGQYSSLERVLASRGVSMRTSAADYQRAHELPGWYAVMSDFTPETYSSVGAAIDDALGAARQLGGGAAVVKDFVKSMKHYWEEAAFIPDVADEPRARSVINRFLQLRGSDLVGGVVVRRFEEFVGSEVRTWWMDGRCGLVTAHPDTASDAPPSDLDVRWLNAAVSKLDLPFITVDLALRTDGRWRVVEVGDGQVSDLPESANASELIAALDHRG